MIYSLVVQDAFLWHASLRDNLDPERKLEDAELWRALEHVGMKDAVTSLAEKLDTIIEDGGSLSKGQVNRFVVFYVDTLMSPFSRNNCSV